MTARAFPLPAHLAFSEKIKPYVSSSLTQSCAQSLSIEELCHQQGFEQSAFIKAPLAYASLPGAPELRQHIAEFHQQLNHHKFQLTAEHVVTFCGAQEALSALYQLVLTPGDEVVVITPCYPSLVSMAKTLGCRVHQIALSEASGWQVTLDDFKQVVNEKTKLIVVNSPHNPSGQIISSELSEGILQLARQHQCYLIADDVSQASNYFQQELSHGYLDYDKAFVVSVMSKSFGLAGLRIGWLVSRNPDNLNSLLAIKSRGSICCSVVDEHLAILAFEQRQNILMRNNKIIEENIKLFQTFVDQHEQWFAWQPPKAGILALVKLNSAIPVEAWAMELVKNTGILVLPSELFGLPGQYFRLGLGQKSFRETLMKLEHYLKKAETFPRNIA